MEGKRYSTLICLILLLASILIINLISDKGDATNTSEKYALIAVSSINQTHETEYQKSVAFYEYLIDEGYSPANIRYFGPDTITYTDDNSTVGNIESGFEAIINASSDNDNVVIYVSDHISHISQVEFHFNDGVINQTLMNSWLDSISCSEMTFIMNGNRSGLVREFRSPGRTIMSSMSSIDEYSPDHFNITRSLETGLADSNNDGIVTLREAFYYERLILIYEQRPQHPQIWLN
jgi:hypothetical protein